MSDRRLSRRQIIAGLSAVGLAGGFSSAALGRGTLSYLRDTEVLDSTLRGGEFDLVVEWDHHGKTGVADGTTVTLPLGTLDADTREDAATMTVSLPTPDANPAVVWVRADCPVPERSLLAEQLSMTLLVGDCSSEPTVLTSGSVREVAETLRNGINLTAALEEDCLDPGETVCLYASWTLDDAYAGSESITWPLTFGAVQCRHDDGTSPFPTVETGGCAGPAPCECCTPIGKLDVDPRESNVPSENYLPPGRYAFNEGSADYELVVTESVEKDDGETVGVAFTLDPVGDTPAPRLCRVELVGSTARATYEVLKLGAPDASTPGVLFAPLKQGVEEADSLDDYLGISHITVSICQQQSADGSCAEPPDWYHTE
ncbi:hypothetical protein [Halospeciosus flavus]|uniref:SipW-cognate class signal peptide n=1 Tax=Halospeciosus flavus TaxID=3032283 RepID=A0ABD5Z375_9EURY|nr:hypothetical protein [Halospeciosus flavus]